jgi:hypothetical protein
VVALAPQCRCYRGLKDRHDGPVIGSHHRFGVLVEVGCVQWLEGNYVVPCMSAFIGPVATTCAFLVFLLMHCGKPWS